MKMILENDKGNLDNFFAVSRICESGTDKTTNFTILFKSFMLSEYDLVPHFFDKTSAEFSDRLIIVSIGKPASAIAGASELAILPAPINAAGKS
jgi:hypothetical protein